MCLFVAVQASRSFLTVTVAQCVPSKKRKREAVAGAPHAKDLAASAPAATAPAAPLPATDPPVAADAAAVNSAADGKISTVATETCASSADVPAASSSAVAAPAAAAPPYPLEHYQVTLAQMQAANYPLPGMTQGGQKVLPEAFVSPDTPGQKPIQQNVSTCQSSKPQFANIVDNDHHRTLACLHSSQMT